MERHRSHQVGMLYRRTATVVSQKQVQATYQVLVALASIIVVFHIVSVKNESKVSVALKVLSQEIRNANTSIYLPFL